MAVAVRETILTAKALDDLVSKNVGKMWEKVAENVKDNAKKVQIDFDVAFKTYLRRAYEKYHKIKTLIYKTEPKELYSFFVCNTLTLDGQTIDAADINNLLDISHFIILEGTGGIGKSTLMKHFFINTLQRTDLIPIFIELRDINTFSGSVLEFAYHSISRLGFALEEKYFDYALKTGCFALFLDGYDEVAAEKADMVFKEIDELCDRYCDNYFFISSRPNRTFIEFQRFSLIDVDSLNKAQALELVKKLEFDGEIKARFLKALDEKLYTTHRSFASNPLLLTIMLLTYDNYAEIPEKLHIFYENAFETLYSKHDATKAGYRREMRCKLPYDRFKYIFSEFCFRTYINNQFDFSHDQMKETLQKVMKRAGTFDDESYIWDLDNSICVICKDGLTYRFTHRSFQEYFTAYYLKECSDEQQKKICVTLIDRDKRMIHDHIFDMLQDMEQERFEKNVIFTLLERKEKEINLKNDRYTEFFKWLVQEVSICFISKDSDDGEDKIKVEDRIYIHSAEQNCMIDEARKYANFEADKPDKPLTERQQKLMGQFNGGRKEVQKTQEQILNDPLLFDYIKDETWIGESVKIVSGLYQRLLDKQERQKLDLDELLHE